MSSSSQMTCTAYSPGSVGQYRTSQDPSPLSSHSILAWEGPSMEKPGERWEGSESIRGSQASQPGPPCFLLLPPQLLLCPPSMLTLMPFNVFTSSLSPQYQSFVSHSPATQPLTQRPHFCADGFHHKVSRLAHLASLQTRTPCPHFLGSGLWAHLDLKRTGKRKDFASMLGSAPVRTTPLPSFQICRE